MMLLSLVEVPAGLIAAVTAANRRVIDHAKVEVPPDSSLR